MGREFTKWEDVENDFYTPEEIAESDLRNSSKEKRNLPSGKAPIFWCFFTFNTNIFASIDSVLRVHIYEGFLCLKRICICLLIQIMIL